MYKMSALKPEKNAKMFGCLEKRGKMTLTGRWRKWWCILEGHLLLYYKSEKQYSRLSPCYGSLNIALVRSVQLYSGCQIHIETHSQLVILRTKTEEKQQSWYIALVSVLTHGNYRKSSGSSTLNQRDARWISEVHRRGYNRGSTKKRNNSIYTRHLKLSHRCGTFENVSGKLVSSSETVERSSVCNLNNQIFEEIQKNKKFLKPDEIILSPSKSFSTDNSKARTHVTTIKLKKFASYHCLTNTGAKGEKETVGLEKRSISCEYLHLSVYKRKEETNAIQHAPEKNESPAECVSSFLETDQCNLNVCVSAPHGQHKLIKRRPWHFLKKLLPNRKPPLPRTAEWKYSDHEEESHEEEVRLQIPTPRVPDDVTEVQVDGNCPEVADEEQTKSEAPESTSDTNESGEMEESRSLVWISGGDHPIEDECPGLPVKQKVNSSEYSSKIAELNSHPYKSVGREASNPTLDHLLLQLNNVFKTEKATYESHERSTTDKEPDYDFPIPHATLIDKIGHETSADCDYSSTDLITRCDNLISLDMTPDSLEILPWMLTHPKRIDSWLVEDDYQFYEDSDSESETDAIYHDSLNSSRVYS